MASSDDSTKQRIDSLEQTLVKITEQLQLLTRSVEFLQEVPPSHKGQVETQKKIDEQPPKVDGLNFEIDEPNWVKIKGELEAQYKEMEGRLLSQFAERMKAFNDADGFEQMGIADWPISEVGSYPEKFKAPGFEKYDGTGCPKLHARLYVRRMGKYV